MHHWFRYVYACVAITLIGFGCLQADQLVWLDFEAASAGNGKVNVICLDGLADGSDLRISVGTVEITVGTTALELAPTVGERLLQAIKAKRGTVYMPDMDNLQRRRAGILETKIRLVHPDPVTIINGAGIASLLPAFTGTPKGLTDSQLVEDLTNSINSNLAPAQQMTEAEVAAMVMDGILEKIRDAFTGLWVTFTKEEPAEGPFTTVRFISDSDNAFSPGVGVLGAAEKVDRSVNSGAAISKNSDKSDNSWVFLDNFPLTLWDIEGNAEADRDLLKEEVCRMLAHTAIHELGHLFGEDHFRNHPKVLRLSGVADGTPFTINVAGLPVSASTAVGTPADQVAMTIAALINGNGVLSAQGITAQRAAGSIVIRYGKSFQTFRQIADAGLTVVMSEAGKLTPTGARCAMSSGVEIDEVEFSDGIAEMLKRTLGQRTPRHLPPRRSHSKGIGDEDGHGTHRGENRNLLFALPSEVLPGDVNADGADAGTSTDVLLPGGVATDFTIRFAPLPGNVEMSTLRLNTFNLSDDAAAQDVRLFVDGHEIAGAFDHTDGSGSDGTGPLGLLQSHEFTVPEAAFPEFSDGELVVRLDIPSGQSVSVDFVSFYCSTDEFISPRPGVARWPFAGLAQGGSISASIVGSSATCRVSLVTNEGESAAAVAARFLDVLNTDLCLAQQGIVAILDGSVVLISGVGITQQSVSETITDPGLVHTAIPVLSVQGLLLFAFLVLIGGALTLLRR